MSEAAIDALRVDLTRLLLSARSTSDAVNKLRREPDETTTLFRRCKHNEDGGSAARPAIPNAGGTAVAPAAAPAVPRKSPLPDEVDRCLFVFRFRAMHCQELFC